MESYGSHRLSKDKKVNALDINDDIDQRYVAALLIISEAESLELEDCEVEEAHEMVTQFLDRFELDVDRTSGYTTKDKKAKYH